MLRIEAATQKDIQTIRRLAEPIWLAHYPEIIGMEQTRYMLEHMYSAEKLAEQMTAGQVFYLLLLAEIPCGFIGIRAVYGTDDFFIDKFYLDHTQQGSGLGTAAFKVLLEAYPDVKSFRLQVNRQNYKSINFYFKNGFIIEKCLDVSIGGGYEMNDFVMRYKRPDL